MSAGDAGVERTEMRGTRESTAAEVYAEGLARSISDERHWKRRSTIASNARLVCFAGAALIGWLAFGMHLLHRGWTLIPVLMFVGLVIVHDRWLRQLDRAGRERLFYEDGIARLEGEWAGRGDSGDRYLDPTHPYAPDLDLFGRGSLYELLATTRTVPGNDTLADWLLDPADSQTIRARQESVDELRPRVDLRREMAIAGDDPGASHRQSDLGVWAGTATATLPRILGWLAIAATGLSSAGIALFVFTEAGPLPLIVALIVQSAFALSIRSRVLPILAAADTPVQSLARIASLLACVETERFEAPRLAELSRELETTGQPPSAELEQLRRLVDRRDARSNQFFAPIAAFLMWGTHVALGLEAWRLRCGPRLSSWVAAAGEIEALSALASFAFENPEDPFPTLRDDVAIFAGEQLGHPLLPRNICVRNDLKLNGAPQALVMSGSNMSGKSTMLRTVGCNAVLALAGAPVRARRLEISPLQISASIRIVDSLQDGRSHFMAEIMRLRQIVDIARGSRSLFLLDEILHGTNSHDRRIGAEAVIRGLLDAGAIGIVTTHDLALTRIVSDSEGRLSNVHFEDHLEKGSMEFDYSLRDGVVEKSNALELMRSIGLDV